MAATPPLTPRRNSGVGRAPRGGPPEVREIPGVKDAMFRFHIPRSPGDAAAVEMFPHNFPMPGDSVSIIQSHFWPWSFLFGLYLGC